MYSKSVVLALVCLVVLITADDEDRSGGGKNDERGGDDRGEDGGGRGGGGGERRGKRGRGEGREGKHRGGGGPGCGFEEMKKCCPSLPEMIKQESVNACMPARPDGPPPGGEGERGRGGGHHGGFKNRSCMMECAFTANGFTSTGADGKVVLNMEALNAKLAAQATGNWTAVITAAQANCTAAPPVPDQTQTCTSGSGEIAHCLLRQMVPNCPDLVDSKECKKLVDRLSKDDHGPGGKREDRRGGGRKGGRDDEDGGEGGGDGGRRGGRKGGRDGGDDGGEGGEGGRGGRRGGRKGGRDGGGEDGGEGGEGGRGGRRGGRKGGRDGNE